MEFFPPLFLHLHRDALHGGPVVFRHKSDVSNVHKDVCSATVEAVGVCTFPRHGLSLNSYALAFCRDDHWACEVVLVVEAHAVDAELKYFSI